jgi:gluconate 2-dehydrogenase alpha chain
VPLFGSAYHVLTPPHLRELAAAFERRIGGAWRAYLSSVSDTMLRSIEDSRMRQGLQEEFARIEQAMEEELPVLGRGVAFFACRPLGLWRQIPVLLLPDGGTSRECYGASFIPEDCHLQDRGVTWDEVEPYYDQFEHSFGVGGKAGNLDGEIQPGGNPHEGPRSRAYPNLPTRPSYEGRLFADAVSSLGYVPFQGPTAAMMQDFRNLYRVQMLECARRVLFEPCLRARGQGQSADVGAPRTDAAADLRVAPTMQRAARQHGFHRRTGHRRHLHRRPRQRSGAAGEHRGPGCVLLQQHAAAAVVGIGTPYDPRTGKGVVGRNYSYQQGSSVHVFFDDREFNPFIGGGRLNTSIDELNGDVIDRGPLGFIGGAYVNTSARGAAPIKGKVVPRWGGEWKKAVAYNYRRNMAITSHGTCLSYRHNYLDLIPSLSDQNRWAQSRKPMDMIVQG